MVPWQVLLLFQCTHDIWVGIGPIWVEGFWVDDTELEGMCIFIHYIEAKAHKSYVIKKTCFSMHWALVPILP